jgi:hypothetical protein
MATCTCPNRKCEENLHFEMLQKMRLYVEGKHGKKIFKAYCPACNEYMEVNEKGQKRFFQNSSE